MAWLVWVHHQGHGVRDAKGCRVLAWPWVEPNSAREPDNVNCAWGACIGGLDRWRGCLEDSVGVTQPQKAVRLRHLVRSAHVAGGYQQPLSCRGMWRSLKGSRQVQRTDGVLWDETTNLAVRNWPD